MDANHVAMLRNAITRLVQLTDQDWELLIPHLTYRHLKKGDYWISEGKKEQQIGLVINGNMRHYYTHDGEEKTTYFYFENHLVSSYFSALTGQPSQLTIEALTDCHLVIECIPQHLIANYLGITPVSLSRIRRRISGKK